MFGKTLTTIMLTLLLLITLLLMLSVQPLNTGETALINSNAESETQTLKGGNNEIRLTFQFPAPTVSRGAASDSVQMSGLPEYSVPGEPVLPFRIVKVLIPAGKELGSVNVHAGEANVLQGEFYVSYGKAPTPTAPNGVAVGQPNEAIYASADPYPSELFSDVALQYLRGYSVLVLKLFPVHYIPATGELFHFDAMTLTVALKEAGETSPMFRGSPQDAELVASLVDNPDGVKTHCGASMSTEHPSMVNPSDSFEYVIITSNTLTSSFQPLIDAKIANGVTATIVTVENIMKEPAYNWNGLFGDGYNLPRFNDTQAHIRNFIKDAYRNWETEYILLGGDVQVVPSRQVYCYAGDYTKSDIPCDTYYGALDGNWDADLDGTFGETLYRWNTPQPGHTVTPSNGTAGEEADFLLEVYVGRAPVTTEAQVTRFIQKTLAYEQDVQTNPEATYLQNELLISSIFDSITQGGNDLDRVADTVPQYSVTRIYARDGWQIDPWPMFDSVLITSLLNSDNFQIVCHSGHSSANRVMGISKQGASGLTNTKPFLIYSLGCDSVAFDDDSVAERFITSASGGAFAYIGNSRYGLYVQGSTDGPGDRYVRQFFTMLNDGVTNVGKALALSKMQEPLLDRWTVFVLNLLGDPETQLFTAVRAPTARFETRKDLSASPRVGGFIDLQGTAKAGPAGGTTFDYYLIDFGSGIDPSTWKGTGISLANDGQSEVVNGPLALWNTTSVIEGVYTLRLRAFDMDGRVGEDRNVIVVNQTAVPVYIRADGSVDPATELVVREGDVYRLTGNIVADGDVIVIQRNNIVLDGAGYSIQGTGRYGAGIQLVGRSNVTVRDIVITGCLYGVFLEQSSDDTVSGCRVEGNTHGIFLYESSNNRIVENKVSSNDYGIALMFFSNNNTLHENCIANHQGRNAGAVWFYCSSNNSLYHNAFMNNYLHVYDAAWDCADAGIIALSRNIWDSDYPSGGNYWGGYADADSWRGPYQNVTGGDRRGDVPFIVDQINRDRYPLLKPYTLDSHDVGVTSIGDVCHETWTPLKTVVGLGFVLRINVFVRNYGSHPEVLNVTIYANATVVSTLSNIAVASRDFLMLGFTWNTTGSAKGSCTISAYVAPVNGEILTDDNTLVGGTVQVGVPCDVSGQTTGVPDGVCNMRDIGHMCAHFGTTPFTPNWDPNCDITGPSSRVPDYAVNMRDIGEACSNFGKT